MTSRVKLFMWIFEVLITITALVFVVLSVFIICKKTMLHRNLRVLLLNIPAAQAVAFVGRLPLVFSSLNMFTIADSVLNVADTISDYGLFSKALSLIALSLERAAALLYSERYENCGSPFPFLGIALATMQWFCAAFLATTGHFDLIRIYDILLIFTCSYIGAFIIFGTLPWAVRKYNKRKLDELQKTNVFSLSQRYQLSENVKCADDLNPMVLVISVTELLGTLPLIFLLKFKIAAATPDIVVSSYYILSAIQAILMTIALSETFLQLKSKFRKLRVRNVTLTSRDNPITRSAVSAAANDMQKIYFNELSKAWS